MKKLEKKEFDLLKDLFIKLEKYVEDVGYNVNCETIKFPQDRYNIGHLMWEIRELQYEIRAVNIFKNLNI